MRSHLDMYRRLLAVQMRSQLQYRTSFVLDAASNALTSVVESAATVLVLQRFDNNIGGWTMIELALLYGMTDVAYALTDLVFGGFDPDYFAPMVQRGTLDQLLLRPTNITLQILGSTFNLRRFGRIAQGGIILAIALALVGVHWTPIKIVYLPIVLLGQLAFFGGLFIIGSTTTFWTVQRVEIINIFASGGRVAMYYPMHIYTKWVRRTFMIVPIIFLNYYPALFFLDKPDPLGMPAFAPFLAPIAGFGALAQHWHSGSSACGTMRARAREV
jgi:ABC-2 type transport system permease protein